MSVYIPGMEMPANCSDCLACHILSDEGLYCEPLDTDIELGSFGRLANCPLVPVPPHGDLIDRNTLSKRIKEETINQAEFYADRRHPVVLAYGDCYSKVQNAPTIIPAEEEGEGWN